MRNLILCIALSSLLPAAQAVEPTTSDKTGRVAGAWESIKSKVGGGSAEVQEWSAGKVNEMLAEFSSYLPVFRDAGFEVSELSVTMTLIPALAAEFRQIKVIKPEEQAKLLKMHENKIMLSYMLKSLFKVYGMQMRKFKISYVEIALTIPPYTTIALEVKPEEAKPGEVKPEEVKPEDVKPEDVKPAEVK